MHIGFKREMHFYWGVRKEADLYMLDKVKEWEAQGIKFTAVVSDEPWSGRTGFVHQAVQAWLVASQLPPASATPFTPTPFAPDEVPYTPGLMLLKLALVLVVSPYTP